MCRARRETAPGRGLRAVAVTARDGIGVALPGDRMQEKTRVPQKNYRANTVIVATQISQYLELQPAVISRVETGIGRCCNRNSKENLVVSQNKLTTNKYCKSGLEKRAAASRAEGPSSRARVPPMDYGDTRWPFDNAISIRPSDAAAGSDDGGSGTTSTGRKDGVPSPSSPGW